MQQFIGCDAHKKFSVFVAVNEKGHAGEALRVVHDRQCYREFLARLGVSSNSLAEHPPLSNFAPLLGFANQLNSKLVLRG